MKILLTAFDPFGGEAINPAQEAVKAIQLSNSTVELIKLEVPTAFYRSVDIVRGAILAHRPDLVFAVGQAGGRSALSLERVAINCDDARIPDNDGQQPVDKPIIPNAPAAYFSTLPIKAMAQAANAAGIPTVISNSAGTFVCNHLMFGLLHTLETHLPKTRGGFLHVPFIPIQTVDRPAQPSMALATIIRGVTVMLETAILREHDISTVGGALH